MMQELVDKLSAVLGEGWIVEADEAKMQNFKTLDYKGKHVCYIEEYHSAQYVNTMGWKRIDSITLYVYDSGDGKPKTAAQRDAIRSELEEIGIKPILRALDSSISGSIRVDIAPARFNNLETGISLTFNMIKPICL